MLKKIFGMDFGTSMIKIYKKGSGVILDQKNVVAIENRKRVLAVGNEAYDMLEKSPVNIAVSYPIHNGVIADIANMQALLNSFLAKLAGKHGRLGGCGYLVAVPTDITEVEKRAFLDLVQNSNGNAKYVGIVEKPLATALGMDLDITTARGVMTVDIGADTTEIAIMSLGGIVLSKLIPLGGNKLDESIRLYVKKKYNLVIGDKTAEVVKKNLASACLVPEEKVKIYGRDVVTGLPCEMEVDSTMVYEATREHLYSIVDAIRIILERTPPEISSDIIDSGIYVTGGSSQIRNLDKLFRDETELPINIASDPENSVVKGLGAIIEDKALMDLVTSLK